MDLEGEKERKTEAEVDGRCKGGLESEGTVGGGDVTLGNWSETLTAT